MIAQLTLLAGMTVRAIVRRRLTVALLVSMPVAFYLVTHDSIGQAVRSLAFGLSWSVSTVAFFAAVSARNLEPRLSLAGWTRAHLVIGRIGGLVSIAAALVACFTLLVGIDQATADVGGVLTMFVVTSTVAIALGTAVGALVDRELEGTLVLFFAAGLQAIINPFEGYARLLPFWSSRELATWAVDGPEIGSLSDGLIHAAVVTAACAVVVAVAVAGQSSLRDIASQKHKTAQT